MRQDRIVQFGFLIVAVLLAVGPRLILENSPGRPDDGLLHNRYYMVMPWLWALSVPLASVLFGALYWVGNRIGGLTYRNWALWLHLVLWCVGAPMYTAPQSVLVGFYPLETPDLDRVVMNMMAISGVGYCVTLLSLAVFAICIADAILRRIRRRKAL